MVETGTVWADPVLPQYQDQRTGDTDLFLDGVVHGDDPSEKRRVKRTLDETVKQTE